MRQTSSVGPEPVGARVRRAATSPGLMRWSTLTAFITGAASAFAFQPFGLWPLMPLAVALLFELLHRTGTLKRALLIGWLFGLGQFVVGLNWIATAFTYQAAMPAWLGWVAVVLLSLYLAIFPMIAAAVAWTFGRKRLLAMVLALAGAWIITEWLRAGIFTGFAWNPLSVTFLDTPFSGTAAFIGTYGLSALVVAAGGAIWLAGRGAWWAAGAIFAVLLASLGLPQEVPVATKNVPIRIVQPNIGQQDKWRPGFSDIAARRLARLSLAPGPGPRLMFWPEAAVTEPVEDQRIGPYSAFAQFERKRAAAVVGPNDYLLTGGIALFSPDGQRVGAAANSIYVLGQGGRIVGRYDKAHLVPYGEYLPMRPVMSAIGLSRLAPGDTDFMPGPGPRSISIPGIGKVGFQLCYEIIFSGKVADARDRPDFIFNPSNDAWFGAWGPPQHLAQARLRAAEEGIPIIRSTPTGISAIIDARGRVIRSLPWQEAGVIDSELPAPTSASVFAKAGNIIPLLLGLALVIAAIVLQHGRRYRTET